MMIFAQVQHLFSLPTRSLSPFASRSLAIPPTGSSFATLRSAPPRSVLWPSVIVASAIMLFAGSEQSQAQSTNFFFDTLDDTSSVRSRDVVEQSDADDLDNYINRRQNNNQESANTTQQFLPTATPEQEFSRLLFEISQLTEEVRRLKVTVSEMSVEVDTIKQISELALSQSQIGVPIDNGGLTGGTDLPQDTQTQFASLAPRATDAEIDDLYDETVQKYQDGNLEEAKIGFAQFLSRFPNHDLTDAAALYLGKTLARQAKYEMAAKSFLSVINNFPERASVREAYMWLGESFENMGNFAAACETYSKLSSSYSDDFAEVRDALFAQSVMGCPNQDL